MDTKVNLDSFSTISVIGKGSYGKVLLVRQKSTDQIFAMKVVKKFPKNDPRQQNSVLTERRILSEMNDCPFTIDFHSCFQNDRKFFFVLEFCPGGELFELLHKKERLCEMEAQFYAGQLVLALEALHAKNILYRDLKPENILIDKNGYFKITDFGLSRMGIQGSQATTLCGTPEYLAPEMIDRVGYGIAIDWWSLGCLLYEMLVGCPPFYDDDKTELFEQIRFSKPRFPKRLSRDAKDLISRLLLKNPKDRMGSRGGSAEVKEHPWFVALNWEYLREKRYVAPIIPKIGDNFGLGNFSKEFTDIPHNSVSATEESYSHLPGFSV